jgi:lysozyme
MGDTTNVEVGKRYTEDECKESLEKQLLLHADPVLLCTPILRGHPYQLAAAVSFAYNVGTNAYCNSSTARYFNKGDFKNGCRALNTSDSGKLQWVTARGKVLPGLVKRRAKERALCERGL